MNVRTINSAPSREQSVRIGHQLSAPAATSEAGIKMKVVPTCHQLVAADSVAKGTVASSSSRPSRTSALCSGSSGTRSRLASMAELSALRQQEPPLLTGRNFVPD